jgi:tRNA (guanine-N7-)-methyltransferase
MGEDRPRQGAQSRGEVTDTTEKKFHFYGRRKGKTLRRHHSELMEQLLPQLRLALDHPLAGSGKRRWLEIGFGGGEHLAHQAELHPDVSFIGAEPFVNGVAKMLALVEEKNLGNVKLHDHDVRPLLEALPDQSFERIFLLYPDPWPKSRHNKRRLVSDETVAHFHRLLQPRGLFLFASDIDDYVSWTRAHVTAQGGFTEEGDPSQPYENWIETRYESKARREGRGSAYLRFRRRG